MIFSFQYLNIDLIDIYRRKKKYFNIWCFIKLWTLQDGSAWNCLQSPNYSQNWQNTYILWDKNHQWPICGFLKQCLQGSLNRLSQSDLALALFLFHFFNCPCPFAHLQSSLPCIDLGQSKYFSAKSWQRTILRVFLLTHIFVCSFYDKWKCFL